jgi:hypothetical protein
MPTGGSAAPIGGGAPKTYAEQKAEILAKLAAEEERAADAGSECSATDASGGEETEEDEASGEETEDDSGIRVGHWVRFFGSVLPEIE